MFEIYQSVYFKNDKERDEYKIGSLPNKDHPRSCRLIWEEEIGEDRFQWREKWVSTQRLEALPNNERARSLIIKYMLSTDNYPIEHIENYLENADEPSKDGFFEYLADKGIEVERKVDPNTTGLSQGVSSSDVDWNDGEADSDWSDRVEDGEYDPVTDTVHPR